MASNKGNSFRNAADDFQPEEKISQKPLATGKLAWLKDERTHKIMGAFFILFSLFLFVAFTSHILNLSGFETDQDILQSSNWNWYKSNNEKGASNMMGYIGAWFAHLFIHKWFGIASYILLITVFTLGTKLIFNWQFRPMTKILRYSFFTIIWLSVVLGYIFHTTNLHMGGGFGFFGFMWLKNLTGYAGTALVLFLYALSFLVIVYNIDLRFGKNIIPKINEVDNNAKIAFSNQETEAENINNHYEKIHTEIIPETQLPAIDNSKDDGIQLITLPEENSTEQEESSLPINFDVNITKPNKKELPVSNFELKIETIEEEEYVPPISAAKLLEELEDGEERVPNLDEPYDPRLDLPGFQFPTIDLLQEYEFTKVEIDRTELELSKNMIVETLKNYNIAISEIKANIGPTVTLYEIVPAPGVKISRIKNLEDDIALSLAALGIRIIAPIPGRGTIGIEVPNKKPEMVPMRTMIASKKFQECNFELPVILGKTISNELYMADLSKMPHLLCAGATGQGKSVGLNTLIISLLYKKHPSELKFVLVDPKKVELTLYNKIERHYLAKLPGDGDSIITDTKLVCNTLNSLCMEMDERYELLKSAGKRNIIEYNTKFKERKLLPTEGHRFLPYIVVVIDEVADLMMTAGREVETPIARLAQLARAIGIHVILATQRPSVNIITGTIKANFPARLAFRVTSKIDSRTILDSNGADQLIGKGDMLFSTGNDLIRLQCPFVDTPEVEKITEFIGNQRGYASALQLPEYRSDDEAGARDDFNPDERDALFEDAARLIVQTQQGSTSLIQRKLKLGYNRAGRLVDQLEQAGIVGNFEGAKARKVLIPDEASLDIFLDSLYRK